MSGKRAERITDPQRIRALAHPVRLRLLTLLGEEGELTATQCAELTGQTVANCSFHLRTLAKYGYIEPAERPGREKPWRVVAEGHDMRPEPGNPDSVHAIEGIAAVAIDDAVERLRRWVGRLGAEPTEWVEATTILNSSFWATDEELAAISERLGEITDQLSARNSDPMLRPPGARPIRLFASTAVDVEREGRRRPT